ncbi:MAG: insulinase family protein [Proteobacteria bacterium]|nr:insulinase family protein [Pseudomonadota bacterium]
MAVERRPLDTFTLDNGLQVIVLPSGRAPIVTQLLVYKVGSADETFGRTGIAHFLEHMMFKGTATLGPGEFSRTVARNGGRDNAYTGFDATGYHQTIAADRLDLVMRMEADRMAGLRIEEKELRPEREVVLEERRMRIDNVPGALLDESVRAALFGEHKPYAMPTAGYVEDVKKLGAEDLAAFYRRFYAPDNAALIVAGDTTAEAVRKLAEIHYGPIPGRGIEPRHRPSEGPADLPRLVTRADVRVAQPNWSRDYLAPSYRAGDSRHAYALQVLAHLFGGGETSRLWRALVAESRLALSASAEYSPLSLGLSSFGVAAAPARVEAIPDIERAVADQMKRVLDGEVKADEVERTQNRLLAAAIYAQDSLGSGPRRYAAALATGNDIADVEAWPQRIAAVTASDVTAAARHVWRDERAVTSVLKPSGGAR